jgi:hypothetical protein
MIEERCFDCVNTCSLTHKPVFCNDYEEKNYGNYIFKIYDKYMNRTIVQVKFEPDNRNEGMMIAKMRLNGYEEFIPVFNYDPKELHFDEEEFLNKDIDTAIKIRKRREKESQNV